MFGLKRKPKEEAVDLNERSPQLGIKFKDLLVMSNLMGQGADLTKARHALYYLYFPNAGTAGEAARAGEGAGYACAVREVVERPGEWSVVCERHDAILDPNAVNAADDLFQRLADRLGGQFDGWEAAAQP